MSLTPIHRFGAALLTLAAFATQAAEPSQSSTLTVGKVRISRLQDAEFQLPANLLKAIEPAQAKLLLNGRETAATPANAFLVRTEDHVCLVDTGTGPEGKLMERLKSEGVEPSQIDRVFITHVHFDHVGGLIKADGTPAFPKAIVLLAQAESDFWLGDPSNIPEQLRGNLPKLKAALAPYQATGRLKTFKPNEQVAKGVQALPTPGHTPGHTVFAFQSEGKSLWCIGDLIHFGAIQFERPEVAVGFDVDSTLAVSARRAFFQKAAQNQVILAGAHLFSLITLEAKGDGFIAHPVR